MALRSRAFCLSLRSRHLDFIPGGIYQGALNSFIHSFPHSSLLCAHTHTHTHTSMPATLMLFAAYFHIEPFWDCLRFGFLPSKAHSWAGFLPPISDSLGWPLSLLSCLSNACGFLPVPAALSSGLYSRNNFSVSTFFHAGAHARVTRSVWRKRHCPFVQGVRFSVFLSMNARGQAIIYTQLSPWEHCKLVVERLIDIVIDSYFCRHEWLHIWWASVSIQTPVFIPIWSLIQCVLSTDCAEGTR